MGKRYIDADKLKAHYAWWKGGTREMTMDEAKSDFDTIIDLQPTVEAEPIMYDTGSWQTTLTDLPPVEYAPTKHGRWIVKTYEHKYENGYWTENRTECSVCGNRPLYDEYRQKAESNYCPYCGAIMDEVEDDKENT